MQSTEITDLRAAIGARRETILRRLETLVNIPSGSYDAAGVDAMGDAVAALWAPLGFAAERRPVAGFGQQLTLSRRFGGQGRILILGHLDTVWPKEADADWRFRTDENDMAHGPGVGDMKGGLVMAHAAVEALLAAGFDAAAEIRHILVPEEELGSAASRAWIEAEAQAADWVLVLEPARESGAVVVARGAVGALVVRAQGRSAHVMNKEEGASALADLAAKVAPLEALSDPAQGDRVSIGILRGGDARQVVPSLCEMHIDLRARSADRAEALLARVRAVLLQRQDARVTVEISGGITRPAFPPAASARLYALAAAAAAELGIPYGSVTSGGGSDGSFGAALGRPTLDGLGPICFDSCSRRERIPVASLLDRAAVMARLMTRLTDGTTSWA